MAKADASFQIKNIVDLIIYIILLILNIRQIEGGKKTIEKLRQSTKFFLYCLLTLLSCNYFIVQTKYNNENIELEFKT